MVISRHCNQETCGSVGESLEKLTRMMVTYSEGLSEQLQLKLRNRSLRKSGNRDKPETIVSPPFSYYEYINFCCVSGVRSDLIVLKTQGIWRVLDYKI